MYFPQSTLLMLAISFLSNLQLSDCCCQGYNLSFMFNVQCENSFLCVSVYTFPSGQNE